MANVFDYRRALDVIDIHVKAIQLQAEKPLGGQLPQSEIEARFLNIATRATEIAKVASQYI